MQLYPRGMAGCTDVERLRRKETGEDRYPATAADDLNVSHRSHPQTLHSETG